MNSNIRQLEPKQLWNKFADLNAVPRASKKEERVIEFMRNFGEQLNLETIIDDVGNVIIRKPATAGMENKKAIVMQSHLDMVHQKNSDTNFDFETQGIEMYIENDWVKANGTTLGADNGLGVATIMAILESDTIQHPTLEALFTIDEETGMTGAMGLKGGLLNGDILLNLDTEEDDEIGVGCAGGVDITAKLTYKEVSSAPNSVGYKIKVKGLQGGHSGMDIYKGLGNANKIMNRVLFSVCHKEEIKISEIDGGSLRNAIPRESFSIISVDETMVDFFIDQTTQIANAIKAEYLTLEPELEISITKCKSPKKVIPFNTQNKLIKAIYAACNGVYRMSPDIPDLVETSNNIAKVIVANEKIHIGCLTRSSVESSKHDLANTLKSTFELADLKVEFSGDYPGWSPNMQSSILKVTEQVYETLNRKKPKVAACHAGLECGILGTNYPNMEMISFGPTIKGAHSPDERASISSAKKYWNFVLEVLKNIPEKTN